MSETIGLPKKPPEREMREDTYENFVYGLRMAILRKFKTQDAFAKEINIYPSTLSKNLNFENKMGLKKVERLAKAVGMSVMEIVDLGRTYENPDRAPETTTDDTWEEDYFDGMTPVEVSGEIDDYIQRTYDQVAAAMKIVVNRLRVLEKDRARLYDKCEVTKAECEEKRGLFEAMTDAVKVNDRDKNIVFSNRAYDKLAGGLENPPTCGLFCSDGPDCYVAKVLMTGDEMQLIKQLGDRYYGVSASPIFSRSGLVEKVVSVIRDITDAHLEALGKKHERRISDK